MVGLHCFKPKSLIVCTHRFIKKRSKVPEEEIQKAVQIREKYFEDKQLNNKR